MSRAPLAPMGFLVTWQRMVWPGRSSCSMRGWPERALRLDVLGVVADVAVVEDGVLRRADVDESRLHARQHVLDPAPVDVAVDLGGVVGRPRDVVLDQGPPLEQGDLGHLRANVDADHVATDGLAPTLPSARDAPRRRGRSESEPGATSGCPSPRPRRGRGVVARLHSRRRTGGGGRRAGTRAGRLSPIFGFSPGARGGIADGRRNRHGAPLRALHSTAALRTRTRTAAAVAGEDEVDEDEDEDDERLRPRPPRDPRRRRPR